MMYLLFKVKTPTLSMRKCSIKKKSKRQNYFKRIFVIGYSMFWIWISMYTAKQLNIPGVGRRDEWGLRLTLKIKENVPCCHCWCWHWKYNIKSLHTLVNEYLDHMLVQFEQNCMLQTIHNYEVSDKNRSPSWQSIGASFEDLTIV